MTYKNYVDPRTMCGKTHAQMGSAMAQPWVVKGALMPDAHAGYALPIGAVVATEGVIVPSWVGYDIGCGVCAYPLQDVDIIDIKDNATAIHQEILKLVPVGFSSHDTALKVDLSGLTDEGKKIAKVKAGAQLGTLGSGNHFIEIGQAAKDKKPYIIIHSGSRGTGHGLATHYMKIAGGGKAREGHYPLTLDSDEGKAYMQDLDWALQYALDNRKQMVTSVMAAIGKVLRKPPERIKPELLINRNHNHAELKDGLVIHRKGATHAEDGMMGVIPGNMRDGSFIVKGKGNPDSLCSSSHGAGRVMSRSEAKKKVHVQAFKDSMGNITTGDLNDVIDEAPEAYKNIFDVMARQNDLVECIEYIKPILNVKG